MGRILVTDLWWDHHGRKLGLLPNACARLSSGHAVLHFLALDGLPIVHQQLIGRCVQTINTDNTNKKENSMYSLALAVLAGRYHQRLDILRLRPATITLIILVVN